MKILNHMIIISIIILSTISMGCFSEPKPYGDIEYNVSIWTNETATLYLPLPLDLPDYKVSDLISDIKISKKSANTQVTYAVINTTYGKALRVKTTGDVVLSARVGYEYLEMHPNMPIHPFVPGQNEPMFMDLSLRYDKDDKLNYDRWAYLETSNDSGFNVKVYERLSISADFGVESWRNRRDNSSYKGNLTFKPGWQIMKFNHDIYYA
ncbi:MAG: hypothetical protein SCH39_02600 [Methanosarcinales archaeon]|nr:hypothetical protein [Methanosarcinales archaeon]